MVFFDKEDWVTVLVNVSEIRTHGLLAVFILIGSPDEDLTQATFLTLECLEAGSGLDAREQAQQKGRLRKFSAIWQSLYSVVYTSRNQHLH